MNPILAAIRPTAWHNAAQGSALGELNGVGPALKGRDRMCRPFRARPLSLRITQGVALGCVVPSLWGFNGESSEMPPDMTVRAPMLRQILRDKS